MDLEASQAPKDNLDLVDHRVLEENQGQLAHQDCQDLLEYRVVLAVQVLQDSQDRKEPEDPEDHRGQLESVGTLAHKVVLVRLDRLDL
jgi:hypothetical protein